MVIWLCLHVIRMVYFIIRDRFLEDQMTERKGPANFGEERRVEDENPSDKVSPGYEDPKKTNHYRVKPKGKRNRND